MPPLNPLEWDRERNDVGFFLGFHCRTVLAASMKIAKETAPVAADRLRRMRSMFEKEGAIWVEDYEHFTGFKPDAPTHRNKAPRTLARRISQPGRARS